MLTSSHQPLPATDVQPPDAQLSITLGSVTREHNLRKYNVEFSSAENAIYARGKAHMRTTPSLRSFANFAFKTVPTLAC